MKMLLRLNQSAIETNYHDIHAFIMLVKNMQRNSQQK